MGRKKKKKKRHAVLCGLALDSPEPVHNGHAARASHSGCIVRTHAHSCKAWEERNETKGREGGERRKGPIVAVHS